MCAGLEFYGYSVREAATGAAALSGTTRVKPELIVLDLGLPDMSGSQVLETVRSWSNVPIIVMSVHSDEAQIVRTLKLGADDYLIKPFGIAELAARCEAALRRYKESSDKRPVIKTGPLVVNLASRAATLGGKQIILTHNEYRLLSIMASRVGLVVLHDDLFKELWGDSSKDNLQALRVLVRQLRKKIETNPHQPKLLISESGVGYRLKSLVISA